MLDKSIRRSACELAQIVKLVGWRSEASRPMLEVNINGVI